MSGSAGRLLELIRTGAATTRRELLEHTGLSRSTVAARVDQLIAAGFVREAVTETGARGRPTAVLAFDQRHGVVLAADLGARHARATVCDLAGTHLAETTRTLRIADGPDACLGWLQKAWQQLLEQAGPDLPPVVGAGVGVPGPVDVGSGRPVRPPIMPGWHDHPIKERLQDAFGVPALVDNDANLMALGEHLAGPPSCTSLLFVKVATGIGAGVIVNRQLVRGLHGGSGDIGHVRITSDGDGPFCACGARGCLAASASGGAIARILAEQGAPVTSSREAVDLAHTGDPRAVALLRRSALQIGDVLATAVSLLNPELLVVGGDVIRAKEHFMPALQERLYQRTQPLATQDLQVTTSALGDRAGTSGAVAMVVDSVYSPAAVDRALAAS
ncbi:ROK family transcriptional regulator [Jiangella asiatica]|uniref:ROK family transcriptional regulator n=1 Tax=Jiangella asiatica TaxID=2530372 RepID=A0A4R5CRJ7_9ACTN|nr:ROK family transcriptional regulator [Jiangella asiatica]TDE01990.1 ROK family transcriptional regulator [Jiangella asiatica]